MELASKLDLTERICNTFNAHCKLGSKKPISPGHEVDIEELWVDQQLL